MARVEDKKKSSASRRSSGGSSQAQRSTREGRRSAGSAAAEAAVEPAQKPAARPAAEKQPAKQAKDAKKKEQEGGIGAFFTNLFGGGKKKRSDEPQHKGSKSENGFIRYFQETGDELRKVAWPTQEEVTRLSIIVLVTTIIATILLGSFDFIFQQLLRPLLSL